MYMEIMQRRSDSFFFLYGFALFLNSPRSNKFNFSGSDILP